MRPLLLSLLILAGCGGSEPSTLPATGTSEAQAGDPNTGAAMLVLPLIGPTVYMSQAGNVRITVAGTAAAKTHYPAVVVYELALTSPAATGASVSATGDLSYTVMLRLPAGTTDIDGQLQIRAVDPASGLPTGALATARVTAQWEVAAP
jgi:hypothetical protein